MACHIMCQIISRASYYIVFTFLGKTLHCSVLQHYALCYYALCYYAIMSKRSVAADKIVFSLK